MYNTYMYMYMYFIRKTLLRKRLRRTRHRLTSIADMSPS